MDGRTETTETICSHEILWGPNRFASLDADIHVDRHAERQTSMYTSAFITIVCVMHLLHCEIHVYALILYTSLYG